MPYHKHQPRSSSLNSTKILIHNGKVLSLYKDGLSQELLKKLGGTAKIKRLSHIEAPTGNLDNIEFTVDLSPSGGPLLTGFDTYEKAVDAEIAWINENILTNKTNTNHQPTK